MYSKPRRRGPTLTLIQDAPVLNVPESNAMMRETRADGKLDWSVFMARAQAGDRDAYRRLLEAITPYLRVLVARRIGNRSDFEDTVQDILLTLHKVRHTYDPDHPFGPWLVAISHRRIIDRLRQQGRFNAHESPLDEEHETFSGSETNLQEQAVDARMLRDAVARLPARQQDAIRMLKLEDMSLLEASAASGMSVAALKVATHRALKKLRSILEKPQDNS